MKQIKINMNPQIELTVHVTDEMIKDYRECEELSKVDGKDCGKCSWGEIEIDTLGMCQLKEMEQLLKE